jgi:hypothetical protein
MTVNEISRNDTHQYQSFRTINNVSKLWLGSTRFECRRNTDYFGMLLARDLRFSTGEFICS